jgi:hypothetical protein
MMYEKPGKGCVSAAEAHVALDWDALPLQVKVRVLGLERCFGDPETIDGEACRACVVRDDCLKVSFHNFLKIRDMLAVGKGDRLP